MKELYLEDQGNAAGPYPLDQIRELLQAGSLTPDHLASLRPEGPWRPLHEFDLGAAKPAPAPVPAPVPEPAAGPAPSVAEGNTIVSRFIDAAISFCVSPFWRGEQTARAYETYQDFVCLVGQYSLLVSGVIVFLISGVFAAKMNSGVPLIMGLIFAFLMVIGHYLAVKFTAANRDLLHCDTAYLNNDAVPSSVAAFSLLAALVLALAGLGVLVTSFSHNLTGAVAGFLVCLLWATIFFHATILSKECQLLLYVNAGRKDISGGQVFLSIIKFWARLQLALSFIYLGVSGCIAALNLAMAGFVLAFSSSADQADALQNLASALSLFGSSGNPFVAMVGVFGDLGFSGVGELVWGINQAILTALVPLISYGVYLLVVCVVDLLNAVIRTAGNTERIP